MSRVAALSSDRLCRERPVPLTGVSGLGEWGQGWGMRFEEAPERGNPLACTRPVILSLFLLYFPL